MEIPNKRKNIFKKLSKRRKMIKNEQIEENFLP